MIFFSPVHCNCIYIIPGHKNQELAFWRTSTRVLNHLLCSQYICFSCSTKLPEFRVSVFRWELKDPNTSGCCKEIIIFPQTSTDYTDNMKMSSCCSQAECVCGRIIVHLRLPSKSGLKSTSLILLFSCLFLWIICYLWAIICLTVTDGMKGGKKGGRERRLKLNMKTAGEGSRVATLESGSV